MCGRYILTVPFSEIARLYNITNVPNVRARYNIAPTQDVPVVRLNPETGKRALGTVRWGLVPPWSKDLKSSYTMINAKAETVAEKASYREPFKKGRRCIVPADGFYEWKKVDAKTKQPYAIMMKDRSLFGFAGLWERWTDKASGETVDSCTIITTAPNEVCAPIHDRMPVILPLESFEAWLGEKRASADELMALLKPYPADAMMAYPVGASVGNVKNDGPELIELIELAIAR